MDEKYKLFRSVIKRITNSRRPAAKLQMLRMLKNEFSCRHKPGAQSSRIHQNWMAEMQCNFAVDLIDLCRFYVPLPTLV